MTLEYGGYKNDRGDFVRRGKVRIPGGPGDRKQNLNPEDHPAPAAEVIDEDTLTAEDLKEMSNIDGENRDTSHPDDLAVLHDMSWTDRHLDTHSEKEKEPPLGGTQYDRLVRDAGDTSSTSFWNGKKPPVLTERETAEVQDENTPTDADGIQAKFDRTKDIERAQYLERHAELQETKDERRNGLRWFLTLGRGKRNSDKKKKRGGA
jgi:hypothetical protein